MSREGVLLGRKLSNNPKWGGANIVGDFYSDGKPLDTDYGYVDVPRDDKILVEVVKTLKAKANGRCAQLKIVSIPFGIEWEINEYDGNETVEEKHRSWG